MSIIGKITPKIYKYLKVAKKSSIIETAPIKSGISLKGLKPDNDCFSKIIHSQDEIRSAYQEYARSPYINHYLRENLPMSERGNEILSCLKQAIQESEPVTGKFYRGISGCKDEKEVRDFIFNNAGFTSVTPEINKNYASCFAIGKNSAVVEFDIKTPTKAFNAGSYETIFDTKAFTPEKYDLVKVNDGYYRVTEKAAPKAVKHAFISSHVDEGGTLQFAPIADNYVSKTREFVEESSYKATWGVNKGKTVTIPAHYDEKKIMLPHYHIDKLWTTGKGSGTKSVQDVVEQSLADAKTQGRVTLEACCIDGATSPAGFYYKLGFRFNRPDLNETMEKWIAAGGKREDAPFVVGSMHLPAENIEHCLQYGK